MSGRAKVENEEPSLFGLGCAVGFGGGSGRCVVPVIVTQRANDESMVQDQLQRLTDELLRG